MLARRPLFFVLTLGLGLLGAVSAEPMLGDALAPPQPDPVSWTGPAPEPDPEALVVSSAGAVVVPGAPFNIHDRNDTATYFAAEYAASEGVAIGWTGTHSPPVPGTTSSAYRTAIIRRVNLFRAFAGIPATVVENTALSAKCQEAALMMSIDGSLSHFPTPATFPDYYTADGAEAAGKSNLYLGRNGPGSIDGYIQDPGSNNLQVGHRNWIIDPSRAEMGSGDVPTGSGKNRANCLWVIGAGHASPVVRDGFVAWPPPGYVPSALAYPRWSFKRSGVDYTSASVSMTDADGTPVSVSVINRPPAGDTFYPLVWEPAIPLSTASNPRTPPIQDEAYHVVITAAVAGEPTEFHYTVVLFDPANVKAELTGIVYLDINDNGQHDAGEEVPHTPVIANGPGGEVRTVSRADGCYSLAVESTGSYTLTHPDFSTAGTITTNAPAVGSSYALDLPLVFEPTRLSGRTASDTPATELAYRLQGGTEFSGREWVVYQQGILSRIEDAETGLDDITAIVPGGETLADLLDTSTAIDTQSFHFHHAGADDRGIELSGVQPTANSELSFFSQLKLATDDQFARVEVRASGSGPWGTIWSQAGDNSGEGSFNAKTVSLAAYAGTTIDVRFIFFFGFGSFYPQPELGWHVDNIEITEDQAQGVGFVEVDRQDAYGISSTAFTPGEEGMFRFQLVHQQAGHGFPGPFFDLTVDAGLDASMDTQISCDTSSPTHVQLHFTTINFIPYAVELRHTGDLAQAFVDDVVHTPVETAPGVFEVTLPRSSIPTMRYFRFDAEP